MVRPMSNLQDFVRALELDDFVEDCRQLARVDQVPFGLDRVAGSHACHSSVRITASDSLPFGHELITNAANGLQVTGRVGLIFEVYSAGAR